MSYIAFELDALPLVPKVARSAGVAEAVVGWGLTQMWEWCWRSKTDRVTTNHLRGFFGAELGAVLVDFGFLEAAGASLWRVRGAARYLRIQKARSDNGKKAAANGNLKRGKKGSTGKGAPAPLQSVSSTTPVGLQHPIQQASSPTATSDERLATSDERKTSPSADSSEHVALRSALMLVFREVRGAEYPYFAKASRNGQAVNELLAMGPTDAIVAAWRRALRETKFPKVSTLWELVPNIAHFIGAAGVKPRDEPTVYIPGDTTF